MRVESPLVLSANISRPSPFYDEYDVVTCIPDQLWMVFERFNNLTHWTLQYIYIHLRFIALTTKTFPPKQCRFYISCLTDKLFAHCTLGNQFEEKWNSIFLCKSTNKNPGLLAWPSWSLLMVLKRFWSCFSCSDWETSQPANQFSLAGLGDQLRPANPFSSCAFFFWTPLTFIAWTKQKKMLFFITFFNLLFTIFICLARVVVGFGNF